MDGIPAIFKSTVPVPGLVDMATPPFADVGLVSPKREAFWYKRTFTIPDAIPSVARLKLFKAAYGNQVILNGQKFAESWASFTPVNIDVKSALRPGENTILVRVAAHARQTPSGYPHGLDPEKQKYIPGLYDSVEIILTGYPTINNIQTVPDIDTQTVRVQALIQKDDVATQSVVRYTVREHKSGKVVGSAESLVDLSATDTETTVSASIAIEGSRLWSPEDPFLYDITVDTGADQLSHRFGMREFRLDQASGIPYLNGKPYYLRGSNITLYRFFEDPERGNLPWDKEWVRRLHRLVRDMHWNSLRYCIGTPPEFWYDIADEEGILLQDEFPIWNSRHGNIPNDLDPAILSSQLTDFMRDHWNHPSVVIWDAQNETHSTATGQAIAAVRDLDLSNRPWDNGYGRYRPAGDSYESHPYLFNKRGFDFSDLAETTTTPVGNHGGPNINDNPIILNEYAWLWLNRDGTPTTLSRPVYARMFKGDIPGPAELRHTYARLLAGLTEFWRSHRACAGVLHFCILGYSRDGGQTSDHFIDVKNLKLEPNFRRYARDSFSPVGIMIDFFAERTTPSQELQIPVALINDLETEWTGDVEFALLRGDKVITESKQPAVIAPFGRTVVNFSVNVPAENSQYQLRATIPGVDGEAVSSWRDLIVGPPVPDAPTSPGLAIGKTASASSFADGKLYPARYAIDGDPETRWASHHSKDQWLMIDLKEIQEISTIQAVWENAYGKAYSIEISPDGTNWSTVYETANGYGEEPPVTFAPTKARYVRLNGKTPGTRWGFSVWELKVW